LSKLSTSKYYPVMTEIALPEVLEAAAGLSWLTRQTAALR
jgi:hypothetical protein